MARQDWRHLQTFGGKPYRIAADTLGVAGTNVSERAWETVRP